jgi:hypothetical protein
MDENFSPVIFLYGMAIVLAVGKAFTLWIWRALPKPRPGIRQEVMGGHRRRNRPRAAQNASQAPQSRPSIVEEATSDTSKAEGGPRQGALSPIANDKGAI